MREFENLLRETIGLNATSIGASAIQRLIRLRMKRLGIKRTEDYKQLLHSSPAEWTELVESAVVTETWFFRDQEAFAALVGLVRNEWLPRQPTGPLRLLSLPCSSGEEPYSLAMALLEAGLPSEGFRIEAVDISGRALAKAHRGVYGRNSFRGTDLGFRTRWFQPVPGGFALAPAVRRCVQFTQANLLDPRFPGQPASYDFIFCRNLLIYFDAGTRRRALEKIQQLLSPGGVVFVGAAEQPLVLDHGFVSANLPLAFGCRQAQAGAGAEPSAQPMHKIQVKAAATGPSRPVPITPVLSAAEREKRLPQSLADGTPNGAAAALEQAKRLADAGQLQEAAAICEAHLQEQRASAAGWYLLGLVREAAGDANAGDCYRKALYLEPNHYESLLQMALLAEKNGDSARARTFKRRAQRSQNPGASTSS